MFLTEEKKQLTASVEIVPKRDKSAIVTLSPAKYLLLLKKPSNTLRTPIILSTPSLDTVLTPS